MKYYTMDEISEQFSKKRDKVSLLWDALDYMQQYNGRTRWQCVAMAMGYDNIEGLNDTYFKRSEQD